MYTTYVSNDVDNILVFRRGVYLVVIVFAGLARCSVCRVCTMCIEVYCCERGMYSEYGM